MTKKHALTELTEIIDEYNENRLSYDSKELIDIRERLSLCLFYLSDFASAKVAAYEAADYERKRKQAELEEYYRGQKDEITNRNRSLASASNLARKNNKKLEEACADARRQKEKINLIVSSVNHILHAMAGRINNISN